MKKHASEAVILERVRGKGKGKEVLYRMEGEVIGPAEGDGDGMREEEVIVRDPRREKGFKKLPTMRSMRTELIELKYEHDANSTGPPPATSVLVMNISPLTPNHLLKQRFSQYGPLQSYEPQIDKENGSALGIVLVRFATHDEAKKCAEKENGRKGGLQGISKPGEVEEWKAVLDGEGLKMKAVLKELDERKKREREEKRRRDKGLPSLQAPTPTVNGVVPPAAAATSGGNGGPAKVGTPQTPSVSTPLHNRGGVPRLPPHHSLPANPTIAASTSGSSPHVGAPSSHPPAGPLPNGVIPPKPGAALNPQLPAKPLAPAPPPPIPQSLIRARLQAMPMAPRDRDRDRSRDYRDQRDRDGSPRQDDHERDRDRERGRLKSYSISQRSRYHANSFNHYHPSPMRSPSPSLSPVRKSALRSSYEHKSEVDKEKERAEKEKERAVLMNALKENGHDHVKVEVGMLRNIKDEEVRTFFQDFEHDLDKVLRDHTGFYVTFSKSTTARRTVAVLERKTLGHQSVTLTVCPPPTSASAGVIEKRWTDEEMVEQAQKMIIDELRALLAKDITDRIVMPELRRVMLEERSHRTQALMEQKPLEKRGLKGLSFKKAKPKEVVQEAVEVKEVEEQEEVEERPKKKRKKDVKKVAKKVVEELEAESEEEDEADTVRIEEVRRKRLTSEARDEEEEEEQPMRKKQRKEVAVEVKGKKALKKKFLQKKEIVDDVVQPADFDVPSVTDVQITDAFDSSLSPSRSPSPPPVSKRRPRVPTPQPTPPPDPVGLGLCEDDEDIFFVKLALSGYKLPTVDVPEPPPPSATAVPFRKHVTGSARTEGFYKITHAEKAAYVAQYQSRTNTSQVELPGPAEDPQSQHVTSSRSNRANARRRAQGLEEINQVQRAVALSKGESAANELTFKFNQLQTRKKHLRFARSPIHDWGLYAMEKISKGEMVIEYVGEVIRAQVAEKREKTYERQGIGSSYLFRIDEDLVVDATKKGNLGRLINHSCDPNCTAKIITISGEKKIVIYAKQDIELGDEITYDYHFPFEQDKILCLCGSVKCRGFLN